MPLDITRPVWAQRCINVHTFDSMTRSYSIPLPLSKSSGAWCRWSWWWWWCRCTPKMSSGMSSNYRERQRACISMSIWHSNNRMPLRKIGNVFFRKKNSFLRTTGKTVNSSIYRCRLFPKFICIQMKRYYYRNKKNALILFTFGFFST